MSSCAWQNRLRKPHWRWTMPCSACGASCMFTPLGTVAAALSSAALNSTEEADCHCSCHCCSRAGGRWAVEPWSGGRAALSQWGEHPHSILKCAHCLHRRCWSPPSWNMAFRYSMPVSKMADLSFSWPPNIRLWPPTLRRCGGMEIHILSRFGTLYGKFGSFYPGLGHYFGHWNTVPLPKNGFWWCAKCIRRSHFRSTATIGSSMGGTLLDNILLEYFVYIHVYVHLTFFAPLYIT